MSDFTHAEIEDHRRVDAMLIGAMVAGQITSYELGPLERDENGQARCKANVNLPVVLDHIECHLVI